MGGGAPAMVREEERKERFQACKNYFRCLVIIAAVMMVRHCGSLPEVVHLSQVRSDVTAALFPRRLRFSTRAPSCAFLLGRSSDHGPIDRDHKTSNTTTHDPIAIGEYTMIN